MLFSGVVREETGGRRVKYLEYEAHEPMAAAKMREIAGAVRQRWPGVRGSPSCTGSAGSRSASRA